MLISPLTTDEARRLFKVQTAAMCEVLQQLYTLIPTHHQKFISQTISTTFPTGLVSTQTPTPPHTASLAPDFNGMPRNCQGALTSTSSGFEIQTGQQPVSTQKLPPCRVAPKVPSRIIPQVPHGKEGWKQVIRDWEHADPSRSLEVALKKWDPSWYSGSQEASQPNGSLYNQCRIIAKEFMYVQILCPLPGSMIH